MRTILCVAYLLILFTPSAGVVTPKSDTEPVGPANPRMSLQVEAEGCALRGLSSSFRSGLLSSSGNFELDVAFQQEGLALINLFGVVPRGFFFRDHGSPNAFATSEVVTPQGPDGTVALGISLASSELWRDGGVGYAVPAIMAHEFAHILQFKRRTRAQTKVLELQADYLAGWYMGRRATFRWTDLRPAIQSFFEKGDYAYNDPSHHGTPNERLAAISAGIRNSNLGLFAAYDDALQFAKRSRP